MNPALFFSFIALAVASSPLGIYQIVQRKKVIAGYRRMMTGTPEEIARYAKALDENDVDETEGKLNTKLTMILLRLTVLELGISGLMLEDGPSLILNGIVLMVDMDASQKATESTYASFLSFAFSCLMAGRKMGLPSRRKEALANKRDLEEKMRKKGWLHENEDDSVLDENKNRRKSIEGIFDGLRTVRSTQVVPLAGNVSASTASSDLGNLGINEFNAKDEGDARAAASTDDAGEIDRLKRQLVSLRNEKQEALMREESALKEKEEEKKDKEDALKGKEEALKREESALKEKEIAQKRGEELEAENFGLRSRSSRVIADG